MMTRRQQKAFRKQFDKQVEEERNGAPIPGDIAARMTKVKEPDPLYQAVVTVKNSGRKIAVGPMMLKPYAEELVSTINRHIIDGKEKLWSNADVAPMTPISAGAH